MRITRAGLPFGCGLPTRSLLWACGLVCLAAAALFILPSAAAASGEDWHVPGPIEENNAAAYPPQVAADGGGNVSAVWSQWDGAHLSLWANHFEPLSGWGNATLIEGDDAGDAEDAQVAADGIGGAVAVWVQREGTRYNIWANRFTAGAGWGAAGPIEAVDTTDMFSPEIACDRNGTCVAVWEENSGPNGTVWTNRFAVDSGWGTATPLETQNVGSVVSPQVGVDANGGAVAVWYRYNGSRPDIWASRFVAGSGWSAVELVETIDGGRALDPQVGVDDAGNAIAVWTQNFGVDAYTMANEYMPGTGWGTPQIIGNPALSPQVAVSRNGDAMAMGGGYMSIWAARYVRGSGWADPEYFNFSSGTRDSVRVATDENGNAFALWREWDGSSSNLSARRYEAGTGWGSAAIISPGSSGDPALAVDAEGNAVAAWREGGLGPNARIFANEYGAAWNVTIQSAPPGLTVVIGGTNQTAPASIGCFNGTILVGAPSPQQVGRARYSFSNWSDGGAQVHSAPCQRNGVIVAAFSAYEYHINLATSPPGLDLVVDGATVPGNSSFWWSVGNFHSLSLPANQTLGPARYRPSNWSDSAPSNRTLMVDRPFDLLANFVAFEYRLDLISSPAGRTVSVDGLPGLTPTAFWVAVGAQVTLDVASPQPGPPGMRYQFERWEDGGPQNRTVVVDSPLALTVRFFEEDSVTIVSSPLDFVLSIDGVELRAPSSAWWARGSTHMLGGPAGTQEIGPIRYALSRWRDVSAPNRTLVAAGPEQFEAVFSPAEYFVSFDTSPSSLELAVDGVTQLALAATWWDAGSSHSIVALSPQTSGSERYVFTGWSDSLPSSHSVIADGPLMLSAAFDLQFAITVDSSPSGIRLAVDGRFYTAPVSTWWFNQSSHTIEAPLGTTVSPETRLVYSRWSDGGNISHLVFIGRSLSIRADFVTMFLMLADSAFVVPQCDAPDCWYANGSTATVSVSEFLSAGEGSRNAFVGWEGEVTSAAASTAVVMDGPKQMNATWKLQFELRIDSTYGFASGEGWYDAGATAHLAVTLSNVTVGGLLYTFAGWQGSVESDRPEVDLTMDSPKQVSVQWAPAARTGGSLPIEVAGAGLLSLILAGIITVVSSRAGFALDGFVAAPLFTRLRRIDVTSQFQRGRLIQFIADNPGASYSEIRRHLKIANGGCAYHLRVLERNGEVRRMAHGASVRFYPADFKVDPEALPPLSLVQRRILELLLQRPNSVAVDIRKVLNDEGHALGESAVFYHLKALVREKGLISMRREGGRTLYFVTAEQRTYLQRRLGEEAAADMALDQAIGPSPDHTSTEQMARKDVTE